MARKLNIWNGRFITRPKNDVDVELYNKHRSIHGYVCAYSRADAARVIEEYLGYKPLGIDNEIKVYWSDGCWGRTMDGIEPERGLWICFGEHSQDRVLKRVV